MTDERKEKAFRILCLHNITDYEKIMSLMKLGYETEDMIELVLEFGDALELNKK